MTWINEATVETLAMKEEALKEKNTRDALALRNKILFSTILVNGHTWQVDKCSRDNMREAIDYAIRTDKPVEETRGWLPADSDVPVQVTVADLEVILNAYTERMDSLYIQYITWKNGDRLTPFVYIEV